MTRKLYYEDCHIREFTARVVSCEETPKGWEVVLDRTAFYPEGGGQACDIGTLGGVKVLDTRERGEEAIREEILADLAAEALFGESSGLYLRLYDQGLIDSSFGGGFETIEGMAMLTASGDSKDPRAVSRAILDRAAQLADRGMEDEDFLRMKRSAMGRRIRGLDSFDSTAFRLCAYYLSDFDYFRFPQIYQQVEKEEILEFLRQNVTRQRMSLSIIKEAT